MPTVIRLTVFAASRARQGIAVCSRADPPDTGPRGGPGGTGGGGLAGARHLHNRGITVSVVLAGGPLAPVTAQQASILTRMGILIREDPAPAAWSSTRCSATGCTGTRADGPQS